MLEGVLTLQPDNGVVVGLAEFALCSVLYRWHEDGFTDLRSAWRLPGRALVLGMPLTFAVTAALAHSIVGLSWTEAMLVGAVLAPLTRCSPPRSWDGRKSRLGCGHCSMSRAASTTVLHCR